MRFAAIFLVVLIVGGCMLSSLPASAQSIKDNNRIEDIDIIGNKRVAGGTIL